MKNILAKKEMTPDIIAQPLLQALVQNIIIADEGQIVIFLSDSNIHTNKEVSSIRKELMEKEAILKGWPISIDHLEPKLFITKL